MIDSKALVAGFVVAAFVVAPAARSATLDSVAVVAGTAVDAEYDGLFESLNDDYAAGDFASTAAGRVFGSFESERRSIVEFAIGSIPSGSSVTSALLLMRFVSASTERGVFAVYGREGDGLLSVADATATSSLVGAQPGSFNLSVDVSPFVQGLVDGGTPYAGFTILEWVDGVNTNFAVGPGFAPGSLPPTLHVEYAPEPGVASLHAAALAALGGCAGWRRSRPRSAKCQSGARRSPQMRGPPPATIVSPTTTKPRAA